MNPFPLFLRAAFGALCLVLVLSAASFAQDAPPDVTIGSKAPISTISLTDQGAQPMAITVTVGAQVTWVNATADMVTLSNQPLIVGGGSSVFMPLVTRVGSGSGADAIAPAEVLWVSEQIAPGGRYTRTFAAVGAFPFYTNFIAGIAGTVYVVAPPNRPPTAVDDTGATTMDVPVSIQVTTNDSDPDADPISVIAVGIPDHGFTSIIDGTTVRYGPAPESTSTGVFTYTISDGSLTDSATVTVTVSPGANRPPVAVDDTAVTDSGTAVAIVVTANDSDPDGNVLMLTAVTPASHGVLAQSSQTTLVYTPTAGYVGLDTFTYIVSDGTLADTGAVTVTVSPLPNAAPTALDDLAATTKNIATTVAVLANDSDPDDDTLSIAGVLDPPHGVATAQGSSVLYSPDVDYVGSDVFTYTVGDGRGSLGDAVVRVTVLSDTVASTAWIDAEKGGVVAVGDTALVIPSGALTTSTFVTISEQISGTTMQSDGMMAVLLEPSGLAFNKPATLTINYGDTGDYDEDLLQVIAPNEITGEWEPQIIVDQDKTQNTVTTTLYHFSWRFAWVDEPLYVVMEIPGKFLSPGDVLVRMDGHYDAAKPNNGCDGTARWLPGHTAVYSDTVGATLLTDGTSRVIEANVSNKLVLNCLSPGGVAAVTFNQLLEQSCGFYMGAQRNLNASESTRGRARTIALSQINKGYNALAQGNVFPVVSYWSPLVEFNCYSCVGLVEFAYDSAGASIIGRFWENLPITPLQQYRKLHPVDEITAQVGEVIRIPVKGVYQVPEALWFDHYEILNLSPTASYLPDGSTYTGGVFEWTPPTAARGNTYTVQFHVQTVVLGKVRTATQSLSIHVAMPPNHQPYAFDDSVTTPQNTAVDVDVLANDTDPENDPLSVSYFSDPLHGSTAMQGDKIRYTPDANYSGLDTFVYDASDGGLSDTATVTVTVTQAQSVTHVFDDFSAYAAGSFPSGWSAFGSGQFTPTIQEQGGTGPAYQVLDFQEVGWQYWDKFAIHDGIVASDVYTAQVKLHFLNTVADRAGLTIAWDRAVWSRIDIQPNVFNDDIEFRSSYSGTVNTLIPNLAIAANTDYWLRAVAKNLGPNQGQVDVYWSTDGANFVKVLEATGLSRISGEVGVSTAGPHMPHTQFDDFQVAASVVPPRLNNFAVPARPEAGTSTGLMIAAGDRLQFTAWGTWCWGSCSGVTGTPGRPNPEELPVALDGYTFGYLIGRIGDWKFPIGDSAQIDSPVSGELYLLMNDRVGWYYDNSGSATVNMDLVPAGSTP